MDRDIEFVYNEDAQSWLAYFEALCKKAHVDISCRKTLDSSLNRNKLPQHAVVVVLSPGHLEFLKNCDFLCFDNCEPGLIFLCGTEKKELEESCSVGKRKVSDHFAQYELWHSMSYDTEQKSLIDILIKLLMPVQLLPTKATSEEPSTIVVSFSKPCKADSEVEVILTDEGDSALCESVKALRVNPYTYIFEAKEHCDGIVWVKVSVDRKIVASSLELTYVSNVSALHDVTQIYMHLMTTMCNLLLTEITPPDISTSDIDEKLTSLFDLEAGSTVPASAFEQIFAAHRYESSGTEKREFEMPTLIHFAAKFGFKELCAKLTDLPDANHAFSVVNCKGQQPHDIARASKHMDLARFLESCYEVDKEFESMYVAYYNESGDLKRGECQQKMKKEAPESGYVRMDGTNVAAEFTEDVYTDVTTDASDQQGMLHRPSQCYKPVISAKLASVRPPVASASPSEVGQTPVRGDMNMPAKQQQLIEIMDMVKKRQITMSMAEILFRDWQMKYDAGLARSFKEKQERMLKMKEEMKIAKDHACNLKGGRWAEHSANLATSALQKRTTAQRDSCTSLSSRDSAFSQRSSCSSTTDIDQLTQTKSSVPPRK